MPRKDDPFNELSRAAAAAGVDGGADTGTVVHEVQRQVAHVMAQGCRQLSVIYMGPEQYKAMARSPKVFFARGVPHVYGAPIKILRMSGVIVV